MPYNIDTWKVKTLENLRIPVDAFYTHPRIDWHPDKEYNEDGILTLVCMESHITGKVNENILEVSEIEISGEGSGTSMDWIVEPALKQSRGRLIASCVWEGGDSINRIIVEEGNVHWEDIEI